MLEGPSYNNQPFTPGNIDEKRQEGEERCGETDNRHDSYEVAHEVQLFLVEEHGGARARAVLLAHEGVTEVRFHLELPRAPEAVLSGHRQGRLVCGVRVCLQVLDTGIGLVTIWEPGKSQFGQMMKL